ncbi:F0F1 ATP synthase subunit delta [Sulfuriferula nivalis]|uniref:ATP synthase subunit delta n=1 Tax=Sulfuriferula nivalis TaxID=2675298 RepID=A0A809SFR0_9PROT|nr:F0F1 ATP synthase subunit delta [Sulfuriferula nivalis]BBP02487.1 ATP synthase subunit delta [Sulfuriferula nivalis]
MAEIATVARPYAEAVFRLAKEANAVNVWSDQLGYVQVVASDAEMQRLSNDPKVEAAQLVELFLGVLGKEVDASIANFITLLIENNRIDVLPEIVHQFEALKAKEGGVLDAQVTSAYPMTAEQIAELSVRLEKKFNRKVSATVSVDPALIGGMIVAVGDEVYDASVRGKLQGMAYALKR